MTRGPRTRAFPRQKIQNRSQPMKIHEFDKRIYRLQSSRRRYRGLTLTELMVVIVIIVVLASISFPISKRMKDSANALTCMSNLRQVGSAMLMYAGDNHQKLPPLSPPRNSEGNRGDIWPRILAKAGYLEDGKDQPLCGTGVWTCPDCDFMSDAYGGFGVAEDTVFVYGDLKAKDTSITGSLKLTMIKDPARTWLVGDACQSAEKPNKGWYAIWSQPDRWGGHGPAERHRGKANVCMADGHVEALTREQIEERELTFNVVR